MVASQRSLLVGQRTQARTCRGWDKQLKEK